TVGPGVAAGADCNRGHPVGDVGARDRLVPLSPLPELEGTVRAPGRQGAVVGAYGHTVNTPQAGRHGLGRRVALDGPELQGAVPAGGNQRAPVLGEGHRRDLVRMALEPAASPA